MAKRKPPGNPLPLSEEIQESAKNIIGRAFKLFVDQSQRFADQIAEFNKKREEVQRKIKNGARRTSGRIV